MLHYPRNSIKTILNTGEFSQHIFEANVTIKGDSLLTYPRVHHHMSPSSQSHFSGTVMLLCPS